MPGGCGVDSASAADSWFPGLRWSLLLCAGGDSGADDVQHLGSPIRPGFAVYDQAAMIKLCGRCIVEKPPLGLFAMLDSECQKRNNPSDSSFFQAVNTTHSKNALLAPPRQRKLRDGDRLSLPSGGGAPTSSPPERSDGLY